MLILQVDGKMVISTLWNQFYHAQVLLLCMLDAQLIGGAKCKHKFPSVLQKTSTLLCKYQFRELTPFMSLMKETSGLFGLLTRDSVFSCTAWEDNESCITFAKSPTCTPMTTHISIKHHHF